MKIEKLISIALICLFISSCSKVADPIKDFGLGSRSVTYQADERVDSLIIPPNLTEPDSQAALNEVEEINDKNVTVKKVSNVELKRDNYRRWLLVDLSLSDTWSVSKDFLRSYGFKIEKENKKIGLLETNYLEIETNVPDKSLGRIRAALSKALKTQYGLPIADKYRIRIEPTNNPVQSEVYLTLSSIGEVVSGSTRVWQPREKDVELETEMLLRLMVFLGDDRSDAINKINSITDSSVSDVIVEPSESGYATLIFPFDKQRSWKMLGWALDELDVEIDDRDQVERSYSINVTPDKSFFSKLLATAKITKTYQLILKEDTSAQTKVIFVDLSEENDEKTISYSAELFNQVASKF